MTRAGVDARGADDDIGRRGKLCNGRSTHGSALGAIAGTPEST